MVLDLDKLFLSRREHSPFQNTIFAVDFTHFIAKKMFFCSK